jgi:dTDP-glucose 4,6-dehydratase
MSERYVVLGSNSFSGAWMTRYLVEQGKEVMGVSRSEEVGGPFAPYRWGKLPGCFCFTRQDINDDISNIVAVISDFKPAKIINFVAQGMVAQSWESPTDWYRTNILGQVTLIEKLRRLSFIEKYVHVTTPEVYGSSKHWRKESFDFNPSTPYAVSRAALDFHLLNLNRFFDFPVVFTRAANVFGPAQQLYRIVPRACIAAKFGNKFRLDGGGVSSRSFIDIRDVVNATEKVAINGQIGETYHISTRKTISIKSLCETIAGIYDKTLDEICVVGDERVGKDDSYMLSSEKIRAELGWKEEFTLNTSLLEVKDWIDEYEDLLKCADFNYSHKK